MGTTQDLTATIDALVDRVGAGAPVEPSLVRMIEQVLGEGYGHAHRLDAHRQRVDRRIAAMRAPDGEPTVTEALCRLIAERDSLDLERIEVRAGLSVLRDRFVALGGTRLASE